MGSKRPEEHRGVTMAGKNSRDRSSWLPFLQALVRAVNRVGCLGRLHGTSRSGWLLPLQALTTALTTALEPWGITCCMP